MRAALAFAASAVMLAAAPASLAAQDADPPARIDRLVLDGTLDEWPDDGLPGVVVSASGRFVVLGVRLSEPLLVQAEGALEATWTPPDSTRRVHWTYAERAGMGAAGPLAWSDLGVRVHPTDRSRDFELAFEVQALAGHLGADPGERVRVTLAVDGQLVLDQMIAWPADGPSVRAPIEIPERGGGVDRVVSWNLESNALFDPDRQPHIGRVLRLLQPTVLVLQEVYDSTASAAAAVLATLFADPTATWNARKAGDVVIATRDSLGRGVDVGFTDFGRALAVPWHTNDAVALVVGVHLPCCTGGTPPADRRRAFLLDRIADLVASLGASTEQPRLGLIVGDLNLVGEANALAPLTEPAPNRGAERPRFRALDVVHLDAEETFTWWQPSSAFAPGRLDYLLVSGDEPGEIVRTFTWIDEDVDRASDHLPLVLDFRARVIR